jgi:O-antigen/teichoic acid export membrane protein
VLVLQPNIDAYFLAKLAPSVVVGWYAVAQRLIGFLLIPATALVGSLYATLCRLHATDFSAYGRLVRESIEMVALVVIPVAVGCGLYPEIGVVIFGRDVYQPAEDTLRLFSVYLLLVYFSMPIASALTAAGRQRVWTAVQLLCVANSLLLDPLLIRHFQRTTGNGATGLPVAAAISESLMVIAGLALLPKGVLQRSMWKPIGRIMAAGCVMLMVAFGLRQLTTLAFVAAPLAGAAYLLALYWSGAIKPEQLLAVRGFLQRRLARFTR